MLRLYVSKGAYKVAAEIRDPLTQCVCQGAEVLTVAGFKELFITAAARFREVVGGGGIFEKLFRNQSQRTDYSGMLRIFRMRKGRHRFDSLSAAEAHKERGDEIIKVLPQSKFVAFELLGKTVKFSPAESGTEAARGVFKPFFRQQFTYGEPDGMMMPIPGPAVIADGFQIEFRIAGVESSGDHLKFNGRHLLKKVKQMKEYETVLASGKSGKDPVIFADQAETADTGPGQLADFFHIFAL